MICWLYRRLSFERLLSRRDSSFICPTILVSPESKERIQYNQAMKMIQSQINLPLSRLDNEQRIASTPQWV
jgi:hypothetical protein